MLYTRYLVPTDIPQIIGSKCFSQIYTLFFNTFAAADEYTRFPCLANFAGLFFSRLAKIAKAEYTRFPEFPQIARLFRVIIQFCQIYFKGFLPYKERNSHVFINILISR